MSRQVLAHQHSAPLEDSRVKKNNTDLHQELEAQKSKRKRLVGNFPSTAIVFLPANLELNVQCQSICYQQVTIILTMLLPWTRAAPCGRKPFSGCSIGPGVRHPGRDHPCTFWSLVGPRGSHLPEELLHSFGIWSNSTSKSIKSNKVSEVRYIVT